MDAIPSDCVAKTVYTIEEVFHKPVALEDYASATLPTSDLRCSEREFSMFAICSSCTVDAPIAYGNSVHSVRHVSKELSSKESALEIQVVDQSANEHDNSSHKTPILSSEVSACDSENFAEELHITWPDTDVSESEEEATYLEYNKIYLPDSTL